MLCYGHCIDDITYKNEQIRLQSRVFGTNLIILRLRITNNRIYNLPYSLLKPIDADTPHAYCQNQISATSAYNQWQI